MSILSSLAINCCMLSLFLLICLLSAIHTEYQRSAPTSVMPITITTMTVRPRQRTSGLPLPLPHSHPPKCMQEVPAIFAQHDKDVNIVGNSTGHPHFNLIEVCCHGYKRYVFDWSKCVPDCAGKCQHNGFCLERGVCQCFDEFVLNHRNDCVATCPLGCSHGQCYLNGTCICSAGYELDPTKKFCVPQCELSCGHNEVCVAPDTCVCAEGYAKSTPHLKMGCQPVCIPDCGYGHCVGPNECECFLGYQKRQNKSICESNCYLRCENGFCVNHTTCICQNGYRYDRNTTSCLPDCGDNCENGICVSPGICRCFNGYVKNGPKCDAVCEHGCGFYGKCIAPNLCGCAMIDGPFKSYQRCEFGSCNFLGRCRCEVGTTRFIEKCLSPDEVTTYAAMFQNKLNATVMNEFNLLIGRYFTIEAAFEKFFNYNQFNGIY